MTTISILELPPRHPLMPAPADWYPIYLNQKLLRDIGLSFKFHSQITPTLFQADILFISSRFFPLHTLSPDDHQIALESISSFKFKFKQVIWFDFRDSTGTTQFEILPFIDKYLKKQLLKDLSLYHHSYYGNRLYTDYIHHQFSITDDYQEEYTLLSPDQHHKLGISWNPGLLDFRGGLPSRLAAQRLTDIANVHLDLNRHTRWQSPHTHRSIKLLATFNTNYARQTIAWQRQTAPQILSRITNQSGIIYQQKLTLKQEISARYNAQSILSLFGWGEINSRDFQTFIAGAALLAADTAHLQTWPITHIPNQTYLPIKWDLSNLIESYQQLQDDTKLRLRLAEQGQQTYQQLWTVDFRHEFCDRLKKIITSHPQVNEPQSNSKLATN